MAEAKQIVNALVRARQGSTIAATAVMGGISLIVGLGLKTLSGTERSKEAGALPQNPKPVPQHRTPFDHSDVREDEARTMLQAMVAATMADGLLDNLERQRLYGALATAKIGDTGRAGLNKELGEPASIDQLERFRFGLNRLAGVHRGT